MPVNSTFIISPYNILHPALRWLPADETLPAAFNTIVPPLVPQIRKEVNDWRNRQYEGASATSQALLNWWFNTEHNLPKANGNATEFKYYFAQREAIETVIYLFEVARVRDKNDLIHYDASGHTTAEMFQEEWLRLVLKMATGSGKTKVMTLIVTWSYFHKLYESNSRLSTNFLIIAPNIIVFDRLRADFNGLKIFSCDPVVPENGYEKHNWHDDFQMMLHFHDDISIVRRTGNFILANIHNVSLENEVQSEIEDEDTEEDDFLEEEPEINTTELPFDLSLLVKELDELVIINDEAHYIQDNRLDWINSIVEIQNRLKQKELSLSLQIDITATPKHSDGTIFIQTVYDYPLADAIIQNVVKHPVLPDKATRDKLAVKKSSRYSEKYEDFLLLGVEEWRKSRLEHEKVGKKATLFIMTDEPKACDDVAGYLENSFPEFKDAILVIHTRNDGDISEAGIKKDHAELEKLRRASNLIDSWESPYKVIVSVLMLKEGWDIRNVTTIVGLCDADVQCKILPEQSLGRGLRRMYPGSDTTEFITVIGSDGFMNFIESIQNEGVDLIPMPMGKDTRAKAPIVVEIDKENRQKDLDLLEIEIPVLAPRLDRQFKNLEELNPATFGSNKIAYRLYPDEEKKAIVFKDIVTGEIDHSTFLDPAAVTDYRNIIGYFTQIIMKNLRLESGYEILFSKVKEFITEHLFTVAVEIDDLNTLRNLCEIDATKAVIETFNQKINDLAIPDKGLTGIREYLKLRQIRPFVVKEQEFLVSKKSIFNKTVGNYLELLCASHLEKWTDVVAYLKNYLVVNYKIDYIKPDGNISSFSPEFFVKTNRNEIIVVTIKPPKENDLPAKMARLKRWCQDINSLQTKAFFDFVFVDDDDFDKFQPDSFASLLMKFRKYKDL